MATIAETIPIYISRNPGSRGECLRQRGLLPRRDSNLHGYFQIIL
jgi:hypothetical protein